ncbi:MAG: 23S rRNA-methyltransferase [Candidatus Tokpelaia sp. JSC161]|nr:MAG: 23S rRNA-methyltransferase [Candidatus Tokpelaia sp. JSC161]
MTPKDSHYARLRRRYRVARLSEFVPMNKDCIWYYGFHTVEAILHNPKRRIHRLFITKNAYRKLNPGNLISASSLKVIESKMLTRFLGSEVVHQGILIETESLVAKNLDDLHRFSLIIVLDQVTDPHNVGAIMRSAVAFGAHAVIATQRYSPKESAILAKTASGAFDLIDYITVNNLSEALKTLHEMGFKTVALDSEGPHLLHFSFSGQKLALVLGAEGKGLRKKIKETVSVLARFDMPGVIKNLNVSNAAAIALYSAHSYLKQFNI